jgi:hypothetical protein
MTVLRIDDRNDSVEQIGARDETVRKETLRYGPGIRQPRRFDNNAVKGNLARLSLEMQFVEDSNQVTTHRTAYTSIVHLDDLFGRIRDEQLVIHACRTELVLDHRNALAMEFAKNPVEERCLPCAEKPTQDRHRDHRSSHYQLSLGFLPRFVITL